MNPEESEGRRALEILKGAHRGPRDPDVELASQLFAISLGDTDLTRYLEELLRDANPD
jgi:hypothetical protein